MGDKGDKSAARPPKGSQVETRCLKGPKSAIVPFAKPRSGPKSWTGSWVLFRKSSPQNRLMGAIRYLSLLPPDTTWHKVKSPKAYQSGDKGEGRSGTSRDLNPAGLCCSSAHLVQCEPDEASSFTNPNMGPGMYASLRLKLDAWSSAVQGGQRRQKCSSPTRR